ncbi:restriction system protein [Novosphingobium sp. SG751A]|uniref:restriction endonuclease n=1 Tax=Novosphingobium sp. SG751A TaxID=2587000 RepID=UPI0015530FE1|nr:restriction endonuclease [Novosphingobium sp. SG751A]NOW44535.1 restriction system protein [Novosphingobium sp. SG751A]
MTKVWGVHMPVWVGDEPVERGYAAIGWPRLGDIRQIAPSREAFKEALLAAYPGKKPGAIPVDAGTLYRFVHEVKAGDLIAYPSKHNRMVNIGRANGKRWFERSAEAGEDDIPNCLGVDWLGAFPRNEFSQSALNELGAYITLFLLRASAVEYAAKVDLGQTTPAMPADEPAQDDDGASVAASQVAQESAADFVIRRLHSELTGYDFEHFVAHLMECMGYTARVTQMSGDGGVDVIAHTDPMGFQPPIIKIQCKRQTGQIGEPEVSQLLGTLGDGEYALFVTLGSYSRQARIRERNNPRLRLIDGEQLVEMVQANYAQLSPRYRHTLPLKQIYVPDL